MMVWFWRLVTSRWVVFALLVIVAVVWMSHGWDWSKAIMLRTDRRSWYATRMAEAERLGDRPLAVALQRLRDRYGTEVATLALYGPYKEQGLQGMRDLAARAHGEQPPYEVRLAAIAYKMLPKHVETAEAQESWQSFAATHAALSAMLFKTGTGAAAGGSTSPLASSTALDEYLRQLEQTASDPTIWPIVRDDPVALLLWNQYGKALPWQYYHKHRDWLADILIQVVSLARESTAQDTALPDMRELVTVAQRYHPLVQQTVVDLHLGVPGCLLFVAYGDMIQVVVNKAGIPLEEVLAVLFANNDERLARQARDDPQGLAAALVNIRRNKPTVWKYAMARPLVLRFERDIPDLAEPLLREYGQHDIAAFLYTHFGVAPEALDQAARAIHYYGEGAIVMIQRYAPTDRLTPFLRDPHIGHRILPFLAKAGDKGLDEAAANPGWVNKYFDAEGKEIPAPWLQAVPLIGMPLVVVRNWFKGIPNTWGELTWATIDIADALLLLASFGSSSGITVLKEGAETGGQQVLKRLTREEARTFVAEQAGRRGSRLVAQDLSQSLLRRSVTASTSGIIRMSEGSRQIMVWGEKLLLGPGRYAYQRARGVLETWHAVPPLVRRWTYRALLGAGLFVTLTERTIPSLHLIGARLGDVAGALTRETVHAATDAVVAAAQEIFKGMLPEQPSLLVPIVWLVGLGLLVLLLWYAWPLRRREMSHV